ncbi:PREDICTED: membrane-associated progesterone receptor component 2 [Colobus angolensis palliatus]|uniref:membrane-associated progesterone receptor component 2 n=1 Tax=Colobus angolensis palliatus TaxID=336983 RepID=UPI0005F51AF1|nr:PREDICTED: membrane-associated progesterone receptor component 2 [Colobus angolensis palliatus]
MSVRAAVVASSLQTRPPRLLNLAKVCSKSREVWGEVGGASHARAASEKREAAGEIRDNVTPSTPNQELAGAGEESPAASLPRMKKRDFSLEQLRQYDGSRNPRILLAVNGKVFDVTKGSKFYGPAGPYGIFAGRDASRGLATFCLDKDALRDEYDDLSDLNAVQMESVREWEMQFKEKYDYVGRLLKPGEEPSEYTDEEDTKDHNKQD